MAVCAYRRRVRRNEQQGQETAKQTQKHASSKHATCNTSRPATENIVLDKCLKCHAVLESYDDETISLSVICLATFIHREPALAAPLLLDMLHSVSK